MFEPSAILDAAVDAHAKRPSLEEVASHIPEGFECRQCGSAAFNWLTHCASYSESGAVCCGDFRRWVAKARMTSALDLVGMMKATPISKGINNE